MPTRTCCRVPAGRAGGATAAAASAGEQQAAKEPLRITAAFDSGNIKLMHASPCEAVMEIVPDPFCDSDSKAHYQVLVTPPPGTADSP
jgi:hypothetical protein